jgi:hypothetical protein
MNDNEYDETAEVVADAVAQERAAVVAFLRMSPAQGEQLTRVMYEAHAIERGLHRSEEGA